MTAFQPNTIVLPGDQLGKLEESDKNGKVTLGPGLRQTEEQNCCVCKPGILRFKPPNIYWVDSHEKSYIPTKNDSVIGVVTNKAGDIFRVDVGGNELVTLSYLSFEAATKRNRPDVKVGDIVYGNFITANKYMEAELVCVDKFGHCAGMGVIRDGGFLFRCSLNLARKLLSGDHVLLKMLSKNIPYEISVGVNGRVWVKARTVKDTIVIAKAISDSENMNNEEMKLLARKILNQDWT